MSKAATPPPRPSKAAYTPPRYGPYPDWRWRADPVVKGCNHLVHPEGLRSLCFQVKEWGPEVGEPDGGTRCPDCADRLSYAWSQWRRYDGR